MEAAIARGDPTTKSTSDLPLETIKYDGVVKFPGPDGVVVAFRVQALTDNRHRTAPSVRHCFAKYNGELQPTGSLDYLFNEKGTIEVNETGLSKLDFDAVEEVSIENGAEDVEFTDPIVLVACDVPSLIGLVDESWCRG